MAWIIHREPRGRAALARLLGPAADSVSGAPTDDLFESAPAPDVVLLAPTGDFELELEFVHRVSSRLGGAAWVLLPEPAEAAEVQRLFDTLPAELLEFPPQPGRLRRLVHGLVHTRRSDPLSRRLGRDRLAARFAHWFADLELPDLMRSLDPRMTNVPLLVLGEPGTGRGLVARYLHEFGAGRAGAAGPLVHVPCAENDRPRDLLRRIREAAAESGRPSDAPWTIWLQDADRLSEPVQREALSWIEFGLPAGTARTPTLRWIVTGADEAAWLHGGESEPVLARALAGLVIRIPPLRERPLAIERFVADTSARWSTARSERPRRFSEDALQELVEHPWPGNMAGLEAAVERTLAGTSADPLRSSHLRFDPWAPAPVALGEREPGNAAQTARSERAEPTEPTLEAEAPPSRPAEDGGMRRLVGAVAHEVRNPLTSIRTYAELLPEHFDDPEFRERFSELVGNDVRRIEGVVARLQEMSSGLAPQRVPVDVAGMLESLLDERREAIRSRNLLVLRELDRSQPFALADPSLLHRALSGLLDRAFEMVRERGDVYLASRFHAGGPGHAATVRILLRWDRGAGGPRSATEGVSEAEASLELVFAEAVVRAQDGRLALDSTDAQETVVVIDLPAPEDAEAP